MGCSQSKIENEEAVSRCKERKHLMKEAVSSRNAFAAAHSSYAMSLKNTGAALSDFASGEVHHASAAAIAPAALPPSSSAPATAAAAAEIAQPIPETLPPPPPPPSLSAFPPSPLQRAATMPEIKLPRSSGGAGGINGTIIEEEGTLDEEEEMELENRERLVRKSRSRGGSSRGRRMEDEEKEAPPPPPPVVSAAAAEARAVPPPPPQQQPYYDYFFPTVENMPGTTLEETPPPPAPLAPQPPPPQPSLEEVEMEMEPPPPPRKSLDERPKRIEEASGMKGEVEVAVVEKAPALVGGSGRGIKKGKGAVGGRAGVSMLNIFAQLDDDFLKASESAHEVSKMLEATRLHYHSNFADNRGHIDHSARLMRVITWNRSFRGMPNMDDGKDDFDTEENETHATVLDKLLAWEKKLYEEVKAGELMKFEYQRKVSQLNKLKKRGTNSEALERAKAAVSHLHTRYIVDMQSMDSTVSEINRLRDEQLHPKLVQLVDGMAKMWETMQKHHERQAGVSDSLRYLDLSQSVKETSEHHHERTIQLLASVQEWHTQFCRMIDHQKAYIKHLNNWLRLNLVPIESNLKEKVSSPPRVPSPPIQRLLVAWHDRLDKLPDEIARTAIINFAAVISTIMQQQEEEMKLRDKCEETRKELARKTRQFEDWYNKYMQKRIPDELDPDRPDDSAHKDTVAERQFALEQIKRRLEDEEEAYHKQCLQVREKSLASLRTRLPELFRAMSEVADACSDMYGALRSISRRQKPTERQNPSES